MLGRGDFLKTSAVAATVSISIVCCSKILIPTDCLSLNVARVVDFAYVVIFLFKLASNKFY